MPFTSRNTHDSTDRKPLTKQKSDEPAAVRADRTDRRASRAELIRRTPPEQCPETIRGRGTAGVVRARKAARAFADRLSPAPAPDTTDSLVLVVSELVTNAVRHGGGRYTLALSASSETLTVAVGDPSPERPHPRAPDTADGGGGFGWHLVRMLAQEVTVLPGQVVLTGPAPRPGTGTRSHARVRRTARGKTIRAVLPR
ncbi:ATP-binding protein [Streptomyces candidus]|uniref:Anti-sigma regulatory factor (Ser/Thr protein kinase) n=1 Tax=Streptomyces candidus TaxID=67283 RepID=A0A7X0HKF4_9ACTN|nr:ATP-binding protein [Streptomyces candidus]MBB6439299.1 anti-sigma regulatory factor (Ser/Thr protein kinase) [Streptomyces candidus]